ncbi:MAG: succinate dehydrogenase/fumarate reductase iron-sulfur subunit [Candidatus Thorarchaeota archaeon]|nr:MAG: succinate dehydrogenase/fumarate reductase iron-sulfur subunit [Candidatus Thorarchaeota archaeon]
MFVRIARSRDGGAITHYDLYKIAPTKGMTVLDALFQIQDKMDPSLSFRYSCRGAVCGSCGMLINKEPRLACRTQLSEVQTQDMKLKPFASLTDRPTGWNPEKEILVEPLPNLPIEKDLIVDMSRFYDALEKLKLWVDPVEGDEPRTQSPDDRRKIERYVNCIMCAICYGSCPVNAEREEYVGPAALAKTWRFYEDSRTDDPERFVRAARSAEGAPLCDLIMNCVKACPKGVAPGGAIRKMKD